MHETVQKNRRTAVIVMLSVALFVFVFELFRIQILHGDEYVSVMNASASYSVQVEAARGEILDRNGDAMVSNRQSNDVVFDWFDFPSLKDDVSVNNIIISLVRLFESRQEEWLNTLPLVFDVSGGLAFSSEAPEDVEWMKSEEFLNLNTYASEQNCFDALVEEFELSSFSVQDALKIASVRYGMVKNGFSQIVPYVFAEDVSIETVSIIKENGSTYQGVDVDVSARREYADGTLAAHLLGTVGVISSEEYKAKTAATKEKLEDDKLSEDEKQAVRSCSYAMNSDIGKSGIEQLMEEYLRGSSGTKLITEASDGEVEEKYSVLPTTGNTVVLTLDSGLQKVAQEALKKRILELTAADGLEAAGAVVVLDVNSGEVLASASYPSYDLNTYYDEYEKLADDSASPLWNRVLNSTYAPGSTMKPAIAVAALENGVIDSNSSFFCGGTFEYKDQTFSCLDSHGYLNVTSALQYSCNIFFYNVADELGITRMNTYCSLFGLGSKTGIELSEANGVLAGLSYRESIGQSWLPGDTIQAAIGQSDNLFTPIQLANYCATIANGGTRYVPHIIRSVKSSDYVDTLLSVQPQVAVKTGVSEKTLSLVKQGMYQVANDDGTCAAAFSSLPVKVAAKTGTSQKDKIVDGVTLKGNNGFLISFGPYEDAQIAVAVVIENINSGTATANVAADIYQYYFENINSFSDAGAINTLLP